MCDSETSKLEAVGNLLISTQMTRIRAIQAGERELSQELAPVFDDLCCWFRALMEQQALFSPQTSSVPEPACIEPTPP